MRVALVCIALLLLAILPYPGTAQPLPSPTLALEQIKFPQSLLDPNGTQEPVTATWKYQIPSVPQALASYGGTATIQWTADCSDGITISGPTSTQFALDDPGAMTYTGGIQFNVSAAKEAPGLVLRTCTIIGWVEEQGPALPATHEFKQFFQVAVDFVGGMRMEVTPPEAKGEPNSVKFKVHVESLANAHANVAFRLSSGSASPSPAGSELDGWNAKILPLYIEPGQSRDTVLILDPPQGKSLADLEGLWLQAVAVSALDSTRTGPPVVANLLEASTGFEDPLGPAGGDAKSAPAATFAILVLLVGALGLARRRRMDGGPN